MQIDEKLLDKLGHLSALKVPEDQREQMIKSLSEVLEFANILNEIDTSRVQINATEFTPLREDVPVASSAAAKILEHAPARDGQYFCVPKIIE